MKMYLNKRYSIVATFIVNFLIFEIVWQALEMQLYGELKPSIEDGIMLFLLCMVIAVNGYEDAQKELERDKTLEEAKHSVSAEVRKKETI